MKDLPALVRYYSRYPTSVEIADRSYRLLWVNEAYERYTGYARDEVVGKTPRELVRSEVHDDAFFRAIEERLDRGESHVGTVVSKRKDGVLVSHELLVVPVIDADGALEGFVAERRDITARVSAERDLAATATLYRQIFQANPAIKLLIDPETGAIVDANEAAERFYGHPRDVLLAMRIQQINTLAPDEVRRELERARREERTYFRFRHRLASGEERLVDVHTGPVELDGEVRLFSIVHDVTDRERLEVELARASRMESLGRFAGGVAHDFNNLLQVVMTCAQRIDRSLASDSELRTHVERVNEAAMRAAALTRELLLFSRGNVGGEPGCDAGTTLREVARLLETCVGDAISLELDLEDVAMPIGIPRTGFEQILLNLAVNARDAMPRGGALRVRCHRLAAEALDDAGLEPGDYVRIEVEDEGEGMPEDVAAHAFEPFFTTKGEGRGTGLGLSILYGMVTRAGGSVRVSSAVDRGTSFRILLPSVVLSHASPRPSLPPGRMPGGTVLVAEDEPAVREAVVAMLRGLGFDVPALEGPGEWLAYARDRTRPLDLLVSDVVMPGLSGPELLARLRVHRPELPVLFVSGYPGEALERSGLGEASWLSKPFTEEELAHAVRRVLGARGRSLALEG